MSTGDTRTAMQAQDASVPSLLDSVREALKRRVWHSGVTFDAGRCVAIAEALERARVVGVLDAWARSLNYEWVSGFDGAAVEGQPFRCTLSPRINPRSFFGATEDAARAAAAKAIEAGEV